MTKLNDPVCASIGSNTGIPTCSITPKNIVGAIFLPKGTALTAAEVATSAAFITKLQTLVLNPVATRAYPIGPFVELSDKSEETLYTTTGYGVKQFVREGKIGYQFGIMAGGLHLQKALRAFNHTQAHDVLLVDQENVVYGCDDGAGGMKGFSIEEFYANPWKVTDGSNPTKFMIDFMFLDTKELNDDIVYLKLEQNFHSSIKGNIDVELVLVSQTSTKAVIKVQTVGTKTNLYGAYSDDLDDLAVWTCTKAGTAVTPTGVVAVAATEAFEFTLTTPTGAHEFNLVAPAALATGHVGGAPDNGYESTGALTVTFS